MNLTPEYPPEVKPERVGVYKTRHGFGVLGFSYWDGKNWGPCCGTVERAAASDDIGDQNKHWQGLARAQGVNEFRTLLAKPSKL